MTSEALPKSVDDAATLRAIGVAAYLLADVTHGMCRHRAHKPVGASRVDFGLLHAASAATSLIVASVLGMVLLLRPSSPATLRAAGAYGIVGLVGFLAQMVIAMEARLVPMVTWFWAYAAIDYRIAPPSPHVMRDRWLQALSFGG
jgi:hypothetical protein